MSAWTEGDPRSQTQACQSVKGAPQRYTDWKRCNTEVQRLEKVHRRVTETGKGATQEVQELQRLNLGVIGDSTNLV